MHIQQQIVEKFETLLQAVPDFGGRIHVDRFDDFTSADMPAVLLEYGEERIEYDTKNRGRPTPVHRYITTYVYVFARALENISIALVDYKTKVEKAITGDPTLQGLTLETTLLNAAPKIGADPNGPTGLIGMEFMSLVVTPRADPETIL